MPERIYKLQPNRAIQLRGFDSLGAAAAVHSATSNSFKVSGVFRDPADFAVVVLHDADNFYEHPRIKYLPDFDFAGLTLQFDLQSTGLMPLDSPKFPTIDWPFLDVIREDGTTAQIRLSEHAVTVGGALTQAQSTVTVQGSNWKEFDRITLWYLNLNFDYLVPKLETSYAFAPAGGGFLHRVTVNGVDYTTTELPGDTEFSIAARIHSALAAAPEVAATLAPANQVNLRAQQDNGLSFTVSSTAGPSYVLTGTGPNTAAANLAAQINSLNWTAAGALLPLEASAAGPALTIRSQKPGYDGNMITLYAVSKNSQLTTDKADIPLSGGVSDAIWRVTLDFSALGIPRIRQMWFTYSPALANGSALTDTEWQASYTNWTLSGPEQVRALQVAGPDSVRVEQDDAWVSYSGTWGQELGFFSSGYARRSNTPNDAITVKYACAKTHDLYIGTSLYVDRGKVNVSVDGGAPSELNCFLQNEPAVNTRRKVRSAIPPGEHIVTIQVQGAGYFYFDFLEAVVPGDIPDPPALRTGLSPALDYSTDHTYKLPPSRLLWIFDRLGFAGPMNEYIGVFWWNQRKRVNATLPAVTVSFAGTFAAGDAIFLNIGGQAIGKSVFPGESLSTFAKHFSYLINATFVGVWAEASGPVLTIHARSPMPAYAFTFQAWAETLPGSSGTVSYSGSLQNGQPGQWQVDPAQTPALNRGARAWHTDFYEECAARNRPIVTACSMELVLPPSNFIAKFPDGAPVVTAVGFANLTSAHCSFVQPMLDYQKSVFLNIAALQDAAGLTPGIQLGEFLWWFFSNQTAQNPAGGMGFYDPETTAAAQTALGRPLHVFRQPTDDPSVNGGADATFLRNRLRDYAAALQTEVRGSYPGAQVELLFPYDVNYPVPAGIHNLGGALNRFVNFPAEWEQKSTSGFDTLKMEALDFGAWSRNLDLAAEAIEFPMQFGWPLDSVRYLVPVFHPYSAWENEYLRAREAGVPVINLWAFDHVCLYNLRIQEPGQPGRATAS
jgi:hypothetical protein